MCSVVFAQDKGFYYGSRLSLGESDLSSKALNDTKGKLMFQLGAASAYQFTENIGVTADFLFTSKGTKNNGTHQASGVLGNTDRKYAEKISLFTGDVPITLKLSAGLDKLYFKAYAGPSINFQFAGLHSLQYDDDNYNEDNGFENTDITNKLETMNLAFVYGVGVDVKSGDGRLFFLDFRYSNSPGAVGNIYNEDFKSSYLALSAGYLFH